MIFGQHPKRSASTEHLPLGAGGAASEPPIRPSIYLGKFRALTGLFTGHKIFVDTRDVGIAPHLLWEGRWEPWIDHHVLYAVQPGMTVCDAGASFGYYTILMAEKVGPLGRVHAFEPNPAITALLKQSVAVNGFHQRVTIHQVALGEESGELLLNIDPELVGGAFLSPAEALARTDAIPVAVRRLDDLMPSDQTLDFLKVDVEGFEAAVMAGASATLARSELKGALLEFRRTSGEASALPSYIKHLFDRGMTAAALEPSGRQPLADIDAVMAIPLGHLTNILFSATP
jgi:FkbM family methyltransferase